MNKSSGRPVAQLAEQRIPNPQVGGSIPSWPATFAPMGAGWLTGLAIDEICRRVESKHE